MELFDFASRTGAVMVVKHGDMYCVCNRRNTVFYNSRWQFPGGHVNDDEHPRDAALRELLEESGVEPKLNLNSLAVKRSHRFPHIGNSIVLGPPPFIAHFFLWELTESPALYDFKNMESDKHGPWGWFHVDDLLKMHIMPGMKEIFEVHKKAHQTGKSFMYELNTLRFASPH